MKMKNCDLTIPAVLKSLLAAYAGIKPLTRPMWVHLRLKRGETWEIAKVKQSSSNLRGFAFIVDLLNFLKGGLKLFEVLKIELV